MTRGITDVADIVEDHRRRLDILGGEIKEVQDIQQDRVEYSDKNLRLQSDLTVKDQNGDVLEEQTGVLITFTGRSKIIDVLDGSNTDAVSTHQVSDNDVSDRRNESLSNDIVVSRTDNISINADGNLVVETDAEVEKNISISKISVTTDSGDDIQIYNTDINT